MDNVAMIVPWYIALVFSTTLHEAAHAWTALKLGDRTAYLGGQVTLDPRPHIRRSPVGMVVIPLITFLLSGWMMGWASAPYNPVWALRQPKRAALMSLAGPAANLLIVLVVAGLVRLGVAWGAYYAPDEIVFTKIVGTTSDHRFLEAAGALLSILFSLNLLLFSFNLMPLPPLDGSGAVPLFLDATTARRYMDFLWQPGINVFGLVCAWMLFNRVFEPVHLIAINLLHPGCGYH